MVSDVLPRSAITRGWVTTPFARAIEGNSAGRKMRAPLVFAST
jgi:hypothetical protein